MSTEEDPHRDPLPRSEQMRWSALRSTAETLLSPALWSIQKAQEGLANDGAGIGCIPGRA